MTWQQKVNRLDTEEERRSAPSFFPPSLVKVSNISKEQVLFFRNPKEIPVKIPEVKVRVSDLMVIWKWIFITMTDASGSDCILSFVFVFFSSQLNTLFLSFLSSFKPHASSSSVLFFQLVTPCTTSSSSGCPRVQFRWPTTFSCHSFYLKMKWIWDTAPSITTQVFHAM